MIKSAFMDKNFQEASFFIIEWFMPRYNPSTHKLGIFVDFFFLLICSTLFLIACMASILCAYDPTKFVFLGAVVPPKYYTYFPVGMFITALHSYFLFMHALDTACILGLNMVYVCYMTTIITKEFQFGRIYYKTVKSLREPHNLIQFYRSFQVLHENFLCFMGPFIGFAHFLFHLLPIFGSSVLVLYWSKIRYLSKAILLGSIILPVVFWNLMLQLGKYEFVRGNKVLLSWKLFYWRNTLRCKVMKKFQKSCQLLLIRWGRFIVLERMTQFHYMQALLRVTFKALIAAGKH